MATHAELIKAGSFDEKFKNALRDYYSYGFKSYGDFGSSKTTVNADWERLNNILKDYFEWSFDKGTAFFASADSQSMQENPFQRVYQFCIHNQRDPIAFFNILFAMSEKFQLIGIEDEEALINDILGINLKREAGKRDRLKYIKFICGHSAKLQKYTGNSKEKDTIYLIDKNDTRTDNALKKGVRVKKKDVPFVNKLLKYTELFKMYPGSRISIDQEIGKYIEIGSRPASKQVEIPAEDIELVESLVKGKGSLEMYKAIFIKNIIDELESQFARLSLAVQNNVSLSSSQLQCFFPTSAARFTGDTNGINNKLRELESLGIISKENRGSRVSPSAFCWSYSGFTLQAVIEKESTISNRFKGHFMDAVDFFSRYMPLGTVGSHIKHRLCCDNSSPFRFKHEYFTQALNDYNLIDLLYAIENGYWCEIEYSYAIAKTKTTLICFPLDIKISSVNGREYVSYYEPFRRSYSNLRLELIDSIKYIKDGDITDAVSGHVLSLKDPDIENDIKNARHSMNYSWGISTTVEQVGNAIDPAPKRTVKLRVFYDSQTEQFIVNRLQREKRAGTVAVSDSYIDFEADVSDDREMKPWIRSFYSRILSMEGLSEDMLSEKDTSDIRQISQALQWSNIGHTIKPPSAPPEIWGIPEHIVVKRRQPATVHSALFNEIFSLYYRAWANVLTELYSAPDKEHYFESEIDGIISEVLKGLKNELGAHTGRLLRKELKKAMTSNNSFLRKGYVRDDKWVDTAPASTRKEATIGFRPKYSTTSENFFADTLPLTTLECRWLATMINDPKIDIFLSESEIAAIRAFLQSLEPERAKPLPFDKIHYFDRYAPIAETKQQEKAAMPILLDAIRNNCVIELHYISAQQNKITGKFRPIVIEYSKRDDLFRAYLQSCVDGGISVMNLGRVENVILTDDTFDRSEAEAALKNYREQNTKSVQIEFRDTRNVPNRILSEFSPWKKKCVYDKDSEKYRLTIYYQGSDELELVVRLMGYGADIIFCDRENDIYKEIVRRVERQIELTRDYDLVR